jgi:His-Xaa-Ser system radical SAM maturase HxsC
MLPLHTFSKVNGKLTGAPLKVLEVEEALKEKYPLNRVAVLVNDPNKDVSLASLKAIGVAAAITSVAVVEDLKSLPVIHSLRNPEVLNNGDVIRVRPDNGQVRVLYRRGANSNTLFVTERCNSKCIMCSQPPREEDDSWLVKEILSFIHLIDDDQKFLGITGGEPTLLGRDLVEIINKCKECLPDTRLHILTNGRKFSDAKIVEALHNAKNYVAWAVPLYSDIPHIHDYVVQADNAYTDTLNGIYNLGEYGHQIEIRLVLQKQTIARLPNYVDFIYRNLSFVKHVALMGLEPMGYAKMNYNDVWIDPADYAASLTDAAFYLADRGIPVSIYNVPLCVLPKAAWVFARQSISDWKNIYEDECQNCAMKNECCGFFASLGPMWKSRMIQAIQVNGDHDGK